HVALMSGVKETSLAMVLVRAGSKLDPFDVPMLTPVDAAGKALADWTGRLAVQVPPALDAQTLASENLKGIEPRALDSWLGNYQTALVQLAYEHSRNVPSLQLAIRPRPTKMRGQVLGGLTVQPTAAWCAYRLSYMIEGSPVDRVSFTMPTEYAPMVAITSSALRSVSQAEAGKGVTRFTVALLTELTGTLDLTVNFVLPVDPATASLAVPRIMPDAPEGVRSIVAVQNQSRHELAVASRTDLADMAPSEQAKLLNEQIRRSLQFVMESYKPDWSLTMKLTAAPPAVRVPAIIDLMEITTAIDAAGQCRYEVRLAIQNRSEQFLRITMPGELKLWSASVAGAEVRPAVDAATPGEVLIPLIKGGGNALPYDVRLYLAGQGTGPLGRVTRLAPPAIAIVKIPVTRTIWTLRLPKGYYYRAAGGNMSQQAGAAAALVQQVAARVDQSLRMGQDMGELNAVQAARTGYSGQWAAFNEQVGTQLTAARQYIDQNGSSMREGERLLLRSTVDKLDKSLKDAKDQQFARDRELRETLSNTFAGYVNANGGGAVVVENERNKALNDIPQFVQAAGEQQEFNWQRELTKSKTGQKQMQQQGQRSQGGKGSAFNLADDTQAQAEKAGKMLEDLQRSNDQQYQTQLQSKLDYYKDNSAARYYQSKSGRGGQTLSGGNTYSGGVVVNSGTVGINGADLNGDSWGDRANFEKQGNASIALNPNSLSVPDVTVVGGTGFSGHMTNLNGEASRPAGGGAGGGIGTGANGWTLNGSGTISSTDARVGNGELRTSGRERYSRGLRASDDFGGDKMEFSVATGRQRDVDHAEAERQAGQVATASTFSLPVNLPAGEVEMTFARPADQPQVVVWVVQDGVIRMGVGLAVVVAALVLLLAAAIVRRIVRVRRARAAA
ncbi:MAG: hypothetical protein PHU85_17225, partial [Phycisphaerae bacterium]|nr:hypothetical protein [Phycisphaerae bacterium]